MSFVKDLEKTETSFKAIDFREDYIHIQGLEFGFVS